ncbi:glucose dehydrogenase [Endobacter medicaginis]|uniref:DUF1656 domain-containing protein n=1 Tax=Endobacter medicaginis TaxID=1181271 RepID=A0A850NP29_9PROT|nr:DUF1656 domain-containing protein [Endobacter medicaginis]MBB3172334.1 glucose dehydrogenase [Endobacter medicaginis]MCX5476684.1 DUF1656 domain-containing protein [Endobacter medicaginis]NVN30684.1 DUF1656 domain-containing protein [Endobacter medicaginis]
MTHELSLDDILFAPIVAYALVALAIMVPVRWAMWRVGVQRWVWHPALFEFCVYLIILSLLVIHV